MYKYKGFSPDISPVLGVRGTVCVDTIHRAMVIDLGEESQ